jgi:DNA polymerase-1
MWRGFDLNGVTYDMLLAAYLNDAQIAKSEFKVICSSFNYDEVDYDEHVYGKGAKKALPEENIYASHVTKKALAIFKLKDTILNKLKENNQLDLLNELEIPLSSVLAKMEYRGILVDQNELQKQKKDLSFRIKTLEDKIYLLAGRKFNLNSPKQLGEILFVDLGLDTGKKTKGKSYSTSAEVLNELKDAHPIVNEILDYRQLAKLYSTYIEGIEQALFEDSKVHTIYAQALTATGRLSSLEPNLQNIPIRTEEGRQIRKFFKADENAYLMSADYSQIELRVLAHMSDSPHLIEDFNEDKDIHIETAKKVFGSETVSSDERRKAKAVNFGIIYGIGAWSLSDDIQTTPKEAQAFIDKYFEIYPEIKSFMDKVVSDAEQDGFVTTIMNRRRYIPELKSTIYAVK